MKKIINSITVMFIFTAVFITSCGSAPAETAGDLKVIASTSFMADIAQNVAGSRVKVDSLLPIGADPHAYQPAPADVAKIADSKLVILNGVEYEHFIEPLLENAGGERLVVEAAAGLEPHTAEEHVEEPNSADEHTHEAGDPHMWLDPNLVITYVDNIRAGLTEIDPAGAETYQANADAYVAQLAGLDQWIIEQVSTIPVGRRMLVTNHEALGYFAERYGFKVVGAIIPSLSTDAGTSAKELSALIEVVKNSGAPAIFLGEVESPDLAGQIAAETNVKIVDNLYLETLTDGAPAPTYVDMMKHNVSRIVEGLR